MGAAVLLAGARAGAGQALRPVALDARPALAPDLIDPSAPLAATGDAMRLDSLRAMLDRYDQGRTLELEARYDRNGNAEKRLLERRFGVIEHRYRVDGDPRGILRALSGAGRGGVEERALEEILAGRFSAYYFFDGVIRPNVFAPERFVTRLESAVHEKAHLIQPSVYRSLAIPCRWPNPGDSCVRSLEPVAVYLTEFALLARSSPGRGEAGINREIERYLAHEAVRCRHAAPFPRCPAGDRAREYVHLPLELARQVSRHGLEDGIRRFVRGLDLAPLASTPPLGSP
ncbi:MAG TPA: hypothetical protein VM737_01355 [Gemmatimonadota bacterium]|nr:hypothetical protein [Gemmatimonadota bacterium]